jgi:hypothetical protein
MGGRPRCFRRLTPPLASRNRRIRLGGANRYDPSSATGFVAVAGARQQGVRGIAAGSASMAGRAMWSTPVAAPIFDGAEPWEGRWTVSERAPSFLGAAAERAQSPAEKGARISTGAP